MTAIKTAFYWAAAASCASLLVVIVGTSWGPCGPATPWGMLAMFVGLPIGGLVSLGSGLILLVDFLLQDRPSKPLVVHPGDLSSLKLSLNHLEESGLPADCRSETIDIPLLDTSTRRCLKSIVEKGFLTSEEVTKLQLSSRNLALAIQSVEGSQVNYLTDLALSVDQALRFAANGVA